MTYHLPPSHAIILTLMLITAFILFFAWCLYKSCSRAIDAEFVDLQEQRAQGEGAKSAGAVAGA